MRTGLFGSFLDKKDMSLISPRMTDAYLIGVLPMEVLCVECLWHEDPSDNTLMCYQTYLEGAVDIIDSDVTDHPNRLLISSDVAAFYIS